MHKHHHVQSMTLGGFHHHFTPNQGSAIIVAFLVIVVISIGVAIARPGRRTSP